MECSGVGLVIGCYAPEWMNCISSVSLNRGFFSLRFCYSCYSTIFSSSIHFTFSQPVYLHSSLILSSSFSGMQLAALWKILHQNSVCICYHHPSYVHIQPSISDNTSWSVSPSLSLQLWVGLGLLKQMSPVTSILGIRQPISIFLFPCTYLYPNNPSSFRSATSLTSRVCP